MRFAFVFRIMQLRTYYQYVRKITTRDSTTLVKSAQHNKLDDLDTTSRPAGQYVNIGCSWSVYPFDLNITFTCNLTLNIIDAMRQIQGNLILRRHARSKNINKVLVNPLENTPQDRPADPENLKTKYDRPAIKRSQQHNGKCYRIVKVYPLH